ncbi:MAG: QVPTGV class sortase B protein-sorting domain-containing protein [Oscillospiraceae bacterium]|nr:QVPTGV class sortase B protein-sorting domain-containing protein [Oscillospiraceae bacterium]
MSFSITTADGPIVFSDNYHGTINGADIKTGYINELNGIIPTGILLTYTPYIIISVIAVAGIIFLAVRRRRNAE